MFIHNINPVLIKLGFLEIRYYGLVYLFGLLLIYWYLKKNKEKIGLNLNQIDNLLFYSFIGMMVGARLLHFLIWDPSIFVKDFLEIFKIWNGGMSFFGAFIGIVSSVYFYLRKIKKNFWKVSEYFILPITFTLGLGRIANFINAELIGTRSDLPWCVVFPPNSFCSHPYQIYAAISMFVLFGILYYIKKNKLIWFTVLYSLFRFLTDFFREEIRYFGLTYWQYFCILFFIIGVYFLKKKSL